MKLWVNLNASILYVPRYFLEVGCYRVLGSKRLVNCFAILNRAGYADHIPRAFEPHRPTTMMSMEIGLKGHSPPATPSGYSVSLSQAEGMGMQGAAFAFAAEGSI